MRRMGIGLGVGINRSNYAQGIFSAYQSRVIADGGITEAGQCVDAVTGLLLNASLLLIPSGYKGGKLYAEIPTNGNGDLTWTRGSDAFRTNASGLIQRVPWNLLQYSEEFTNAIWTKSTGTPATLVTANTITSPNSTLTADTLYAVNSGSGVRFIVQSSTKVASAVTYAYSVYLKAKEITFATFTCDDGAANGFSGGINLSTGATTSATVGTGATLISVSATSVGDGWYRCVIVGTSNSSTSVRIAVNLASSLTTGYPSVTTNANDGLYLWGAQLVEGTTAQTYLPTTDRLNFPRLSYMYGSCPAALLEPQRTNLVLQSQDFDNASWVKTASSITANVTTSPDGTQNADTLTADGTLNVHQTLTGAISFTNSTTYTYSVYVKKNTNNFIQLYFSASIGGMFANFDINSGVVGSLGTQTGNNPTSSIQSVGNGWYRCSITITANATANASCVIHITSSSTSARAEINTLSTSVYLFGAQLEQGAYPTTIIPTTSATATRVADSFSRSNIYTNGLISASGGTWFVELRNNVAYTRDSASGLEIANSGFTQRIILFNAGGNSRLIVFLTTAGTVYTTTTDTVKLAIKWNGSTASVFANGTKVANNVTFTGLNMENLIGGQGVPFFIQQMALHPEPLTDAKLIELTTL